MALERRYGYGSFLGYIPLSTYFFYMDCDLCSALFPP